MSRPQLDELARDARVGEPVEGLAREIGRQLDEREVGPDLDRAEVAAAEAALVREGADDLARLDAMALADGDPVGRHPAVARALAALGALAAVVAVEAAGPVAAVAAVVEAAPLLLRLGLEQQRRLALCDDREGGGDIDLGHVVVAHVVGDHVAEAVDALGLRRGRR